MLNYQFIRSTCLSILILGYCLLFQNLNAQSYKKEVEELDQYFEKARLQWQVPGLSVTIVKDGKTLLSKGYGLRAMDKSEPVDEETLFMLGSTTKAMTAAAMAMLVDEDKVAWDDLVIDHLPWFKLSDPFVTRELTVQDLFTHNSGLGNTDLLWVLWDYSTEEVVKRIANRPLSYSLRGGYTYQNIMYATAGLIIEEASGQDWDQFVQTRIFDPLGMTRSCALKSCAETFANRSTPHYPTDAGIIKIIDSNADSIGAAGSAWSCPKDIQKWMKFVLDSAVVDGQRLISEQNFTFITQPKIIVPKSSFYPTKVLTKPNFTAYSMGWFLHDYEGEFVQFHTGSLNGSGAIIGLMPEYNLGVYVMVNLDHAEVRHAIMYQVFDKIMGLDSRDWSTDLFKIYSDIDQASKKRRENTVKARIANKPSDMPFLDMIGTYTNDYLGSLNIGLVNGQLRITCRPDRHIILEHWHFNTFIGRIEEYAHDSGDLIDFNRSAKGRLSFDLYGYSFHKQD